MRVDGDGRLAEGRVEHHVGRLAADAGQGFEGGTVCGYLSVVLLDQHAAGGDDVLRLGTEQADGLDVFGKPILPKCQHAFRVRCDRKKAGGGFVDTNIRCLCRQNDRNQQLEWGRVVQFGGRGRIGIT